MDPAERRFALWVCTSHGFQHFLSRIFPPLIPIWVVTFDFSLALAGLLLGVKSLGSAIGQAPFGIAADRYDRRYILPSGIGFAAVCVFLFTLVAAVDVFAVPVGVLGHEVSLQVVVMIVAMLGAGIGGSVLHPVGYPLITENIQPERKGRVLGMWGSAAKLGDGFAPALIGVLLLLMAWTDALFLLSVLVFGYAVLLFVQMGRFETRPPALQPTHPSPTTTAESDTAATSVEDDPGADDGSEGTVGRLRPDPIDVWSIDRRVYVYPILAIFAFFVIRMLAAGGVNVFIPEFITSEYGYSFVLLGIQVTPESTASFYYSALLITAGIVQLGTGRLVELYDSRLVIIALLLVATFVLFVIAFANLSPVMLFVVLLVLGGSLWAVEPARDAIVSEITPVEREGRTFGYLWTGALVVAAFSPVLVGYIGDVAGLRLAFAVLGFSALLSAVPVALLLSRRVYLNINEYRAQQAHPAGDD